MKKIVIAIFIFLILLLLLVIGWLYLDSIRKPKEIKYADNATSISPEVKSYEIGSGPDELQVKSLIKTNLPNIMEITKGGVPFCGNHLYGFDSDSNGIKVYIWAYCEVYYLDNGETKIASSINSPIIMFFDNNLLYITYEIKGSFPEKYRKEIESGFDVSMLFPSPKEQARKHFNNLP